MANSNQQSSNTDDQLMSQIRARLLETGDWDRIAKALKGQLEESGWSDDVKDLAKEKARTMENPNLKILLDQVTSQAQGMIDPSIRRAVEQEIEAVLEREVEKA